MNPRRNLEFLVLDSQIASEDFAKECQREKQFSIRSRKHFWCNSSKNFRETPEGTIEKMSEKKNPWSNSLETYEENPGETL